jgi:hypothetical protein
MTSTEIFAVNDALDDRLVRRGRWCLAAGLVGAAQGLAVLAWPRQVGEARYSYPFTASWDVVAQATFFLQHLPLVLALGTLAALPAVRRQRWARRGLAAATVGFALLSLMELVAMSAATTTNDSTLGTTIDSLYGIPVLTIGVGLVVAAVVLLRRHTVDSRLAWVLLATGVFVFVGLVPVIGTDSFVGGRLAIGAWMLMFALLGWLMQRPGAGTDLAETR